MVVSDFSDFVFQIPFWLEIGLPDASIGLFFCEICTKDFTAQQAQHSG